MIIHTESSQEFQRKKDFLERINEFKVTSDKINKNARIYSVLERVQIRKLKIHHYGAKDFEYLDVNSAKLALDFHTKVSVVVHVGSPSTWEVGVEGSTSSRAAWAT